MYICTNFIYFIFLSMFKYPKNKFFHWAFVVFVFSLSLQSCVNYKNQIYFQGLADSTAKVKTQQPDLIFQRGDQLSIRVYALDENSAAYFNQPMGLGQAANMAQAGNAGNLIGYLVNESGEIEFPKLGILNVLGYTQQRLRDTLQERLKPYLKEPIVTVTLMNFRVTFVTSTDAQTILINNNKTNIIQFLGTARGINWLDKRDNIVVIRTVNDVRQTFRVNLTDASVFNSPAFFLQPNDIIYIEPNSRKFLETNMQLLSYVTTITSTVTIFILFVNDLIR